MVVRHHSPPPQSFHRPKFFSSSSLGVQLQIPRATATSPAVKSDVVFRVKRIRGWITTEEEEVNSPRKRLGEKSHHHDGVAKVAAQDEGGYCHGVRFVTSLCWLRIGKEWDDGPFHKSTDRVFECICCSVLYCLCYTFFTAPPVGIHPIIELLRPTKKLEV